MFSLRIPRWLIAVIIWFGYYKKGLVGRTVLTIGFMTVWFLWNLSRSKTQKILIVVGALIVMVVGVWTYANLTPSQKSQDSNDDGIITQQVPKGVLPEPGKSKYLSMKNAGFVILPGNIPQEGFPDLAYSLQISHSDQLSKLDDPTYVIKYQNPTGQKSSTVIRPDVILQYNEPIGEGGEEYFSQTLKPDLVAGETFFTSPSLDGFENQQYYDVIVEVVVDEEVVDSMSQEIYLNIDQSTLDKLK